MTPYLFDPLLFLRMRIRLSKARSEGSAATRDVQAYGSYGAAAEGPRERTRVRIDRDDDD